MNGEDRGRVHFQPTNPEDLWFATITRDERFDGIFVYAVRSTGIYCRPSCSSKRPGREQVVFFPLPEAAEAAGFRPCRRCRPNSIAVQNPEVQRVQEVCRIIKDQGAFEAMTLSALGERVHLSPGHLQRTFKRIMGISPRQYADACRIERLKAQSGKGGSVTDALYEAGYGSSSRLYEQASGRLGMTPGAYFRRGQGMRIAYAIADCPLGRLLLAATDRGVCAVSLGDSDPPLEEALAEEYSAAELHRDDAGLHRWMEELIKHLDGRQPHPDLPLDIRVTAFQWRVYEALRSIPYGSTRTYSAIAEAIGRPEAVRAVGHACARNPVSLVIPCHRAVRRDGGLGGYRWGLERKKALLNLEREVPTCTSAETQTKAIERLQSGGPAKDP